MNLRQDLVNKVEKAKKLGYSISRIARLADISRDTLDNFLKTPDGNMGTANYEKINKVLDTIIKAGN